MGGVYSVGDRAVNWLRSILKSIGIGRPNTLKADSFPPDIAAQCHRARRDAVIWYQARYGKAPAIKPVRVIIEAYPRNGMAGWTIGISGGYAVHLAREYIATSIGHEFRHTMGCVSEESVK